MGSQSTHGDIYLDREGRRFKLFGGRDKQTKTDAAKIDTIVGECTRLKGVIEGDGSLRIDGYVEGTINVAGDVTVGESGRVKGAKIESRSVKIAGEVQGDVVAEGLVEMAGSAEVKGDVRCSELAIDNGATFDGASHMTDSDTEEGQSTKHDDPAASEE